MTDQKPTAQHLATMLQHAISERISNVSTSRSQHASQLLRSNVDQQQSAVYDWLTAAVDDDLIWEALVDVRQNFEIMRARKRIREYNLGWPGGMGTSKKIEEPPVEEPDPDPEQPQRDLVVRHDTPERMPGVRPILRTQLVQITNPNDGGFVAMEVDKDGALGICVHRGGKIRVKHL